MKIVNSLLTFIVAIVLLNNVALAQSVESDFDGDGYSEFTVVTIGTDSALSWHTTNPISGLAASLTTFGVNGNHIIMAPWKGNPVPEIGVVSLDESGKNIAWKILNSQGVVEERI